MAQRWNLGASFGRIRDLHSERTAIVASDGSIITYLELDRFANSLARLFSAAGLERGDVVAMFHDKSPLMYAAMIACLKKGIIYTNLDPDSPWERLRRMLEVCAPKLLVNGFEQLPHASNTRGLVPRVLDLRTEETRRQLAASDPTPVPDLPEVTGADPAYIMFTSGSTGTPKGAVMSHGNLLNFVDWARSRFDLTADDVFSNANPMFFDNSVFDFYAALFTGASLVPITAQQIREPRQLLEVVNRLRCTIWFSVPSLLVYLLITRALQKSDFVAIRKIIFGGEGFPKAKLKSLYDMFNGRADLENVYGPTECTCICSAHTVSATDFEDMQSLATLGFLAPNFAYEILNDDGAGPGELFLRGPNVGLGYFNDPERTAQAFVQNPRHQRFRDIGYRTGDLVSRDSAGRLHFRGRADFQIKHMGYRIELQEIEAALGAIPEVDECAVIYRKVGEGLGQIAGYVTTASPASAEYLIEAVAKAVPAYMVPKRITVLERLPKNANGKIDRIALHSIASSAP